MMEKVVFRMLERSEISKFSEIERFEEIEEFYCFQNLELVSVKEHLKIETFSQLQEDYLDVLEACFDQGGILLGAFNQKNKLVGLGSIGGKPIHGTTATHQLERFYISHGERGKGLGKELMNRLKREARDLGAQRLYVSSIPTKGSVDFYRKMGFKLTVPIPELFNLEPEDIHLELILK